MLQQNRSICKTTGFRLNVCRNDELGTILQSAGRVVTFGFNLLRKFIMIFLFYRIPGAVLFFMLFSFSNVFATVIAKHIITLKAGLNQPSDIAVADNGDSYVLDGINNRVVVFDKEANVKFSFVGPETEVSLVEPPMGIAIDKNHVYVANSGQAKIDIFSHAGVLRKSIFLFGKKPPEPVSLTIDDADIIWSDRRNHQLCRTNISSGKTLFCWGEKGSGKEQFHFPFQLLKDAEGYIYVVDVINARLQIFNHRGQYFMQIGRPGIGPGELYRPNGLALDDKQNLYIGDSYFGTISIFNNGRYLGYLLDLNKQTLKLKSPVGIKYRQGKLYIADALNNSVEVYQLKYDSSVFVPPQEPDETENISRKNCLICHLSWSPGYKFAAGKTPAPAPVASEHMCYSCHHGAVVDSRRSIGQKHQHPDIQHPRKHKKDGKHTRKDKIPSVVPVLGKDKLYCGSCHDPHVAEKNGGTLYEKHANPWLRIANHDGKLCQRCHESLVDNVWNKKRPEKGVNHSIGTFLETPPEAGARGYALETKLQKGLPARLHRAGATLSPERKMICQSCHQIHGSENESLTAVRIDKSEFCRTCHERQYAKDREEARRKAIHPVNIKLTTPIKLGDEKIDFITCLTCHSAHKGKKGSALLKFESRNGKLCSYCHDQYDALKDTDHDLLNTADKSHNIHAQTPQQSGLCGTCHSLHRADKTRPSLSAVKTYKYEGKEPVLERDRFCLDCHRNKGLAKKSLIKYFSHPSRDMVLRSNPNSMPLINKKGQLAEFGKIACVTCHNPHRWNSKDKTGKENKPDLAAKTHKNQHGNVLNSFLRRQGVRGSFCVDCHGIEAKPRYKYYHDSFVRKSLDEGLLIQTPAGASKLSVNTK